MADIVTEIDGVVPVRIVLASVTNKAGLEELMQGLVEICPDVTIVSTGGTYKRIGDILGTQARGMLVHVDEFLGTKSIAGGLVQTLGRQKSMGTLTNTYTPEHQQDMEGEGIVPIDVVVNNFYAFNEAARAEKTPEEIRNAIDIGGPCMTREAAKNYLRCAALTDPEDYAAFLDDLRQNDGGTSFAFRLHCAAKAFRMAAGYNSGIADHLETLTADKAIEPYKTVHARGK